MAARRVTITPGLAPQDRPNASTETRARVMSNGGHGKRPALRAPGPHAKYEDPEYQREETEEDHLNVRCRENEDPPGKRHQAGQRIEPHAIRASTLTSASSQHRKRPDLTDELNQNSRCDERVDHQAKREEAADD